MASKLIGALIRKRSALLQPVPEKIRRTPEVEVKKLGW
jgi:hypothetical protein